MLENYKTTKELWGGTNTLIDQWLNERQKLLVLFCALAEQKSFDEQNNEHIAQLKQLCEILVDYCSVGHFEIFNQLVKEGESFNDAQGLAEGKAQISNIEPTTDLVLDFNDKYQETDDLSSLATDLSQLGLTLAERFNAEDTLIKVLHDAHTNETTDNPS